MVLEGKGWEGRSPPKGGSVADQACFFRGSDVVCLDISQSRLCVFGTGQVTVARMAREGLVINLMGCMVGVKGHEHLQKQFPFVDVFSPPSDPGPLIAYLTQELNADLGVVIGGCFRFSFLCPIFGKDYT